MTGDQEKTAKKLREMEEADIIVMTSEMLDSCRRNANKDESWIHKVGALLIDESHLIAEKSRGDKLESAIMGFTKINPNARLMLSTATAPNSSDLSDWIQKITGCETIMYSSNYRPCTLSRHFVKFPGTTYQAEEKLRIQISLDLMLEHPDDSFLIFCASKKFQKMFSEIVNKHGIACEFYNADLSYDERLRIYNEFNQKKFRCLIATPGLAWGVNMPARRVIIAHNSFGRSEPVTTATLIQMAGRAGRPKFDKEGDVYFLLAERDYAEVVARVKNGERIESCMKGDVIAFHAIAEIKNKHIKNEEDFFEWYKRTFAFSQGKLLSKKEVNKIFDRLLETKMIKEKEVDIDDSIVYDATPTGTVTAMMYLLPEDVYGWKINFGKYFKEEKNLYDDQSKDFEITKAFVNIESNFYKNKYIDDEYRRYFSGLCGFSVHDYPSYLQMIYYLAMNDKEYPGYLVNEISTVRKDIQRVISALSQIDLRTRIWGKQGFWKTLAMRFKYGVPAERTELCLVPGIGAAYSKKLFNKGIRTVTSLMYNTHMLPDIFGEAIAKKIVTVLESYYSIKKSEEYLNNNLGI